MYGSAGNQGTCTAQGFFFAFSIGCGAYYNMTLALTYLLQVRYEWSEEKLRRYQPFFIFIPIFISLVSATFIIPYSAYNYNGIWCCGTAASPLGCDDKDSGVDCIRGANTKNINFFLSIQGVLINTVIISCMTLLYRTVLIRTPGIERKKFRFFVLALRMQSTPEYLSSHPSGEAAILQHQKPPV